MGVQELRQLTPSDVEARKLSPSDAEALINNLREALSSQDGVCDSVAWRTVSKHVLHPDMPFEVHELLYATCYSGWDAAARGPPPMWVPEPTGMKSTNAARFMENWEGPETWQRLRSGDASKDYALLQRLSATFPESFWPTVFARLRVRFEQAPSAVLTPAPHPDAARWLPGALFNAAESALTGHDPDGTALIWAAEGSPADLKRMSLGELGRRCARAAESFRAAGLVPGDACALVLPMGPEAVIAYLGLILAGCAAVSVAESFSAAEIAARLRISKARAVVTQTALTRGGRSLPLYTRVCEAEAPRCIVLGDKAAANGDAAPLRPGDLSWEAFLELGSARAAAQAAQVRGLATPADSTINVLFSSGTTGEPKAIPFTHTTTLRCGTDAHFCQDVRAGDAVCWPTSMGWMMGPWLVFAALYNGAAVAMFEGAPTSREFGEFVQAARVNVLGLVPSIVKAWRASNCMHGLDWSALRAFSSTGEASAPQDCLWLSARAGYKPVVEYCGGTEIGGGFLSCSPLQPQAPSTFTTPTMGMVPVLLPDAGEPSPHGDAAPMEGELTIVAPALGTAQRLLNRDHAEVYFEGMPSLVPGGPPLRRHGDRFERLPGGAYRARGRSDDTMNLGGIKTSSLELENAILAGVSWVREAAAVAAPPPGGGPDRLEVFVVGDQKSEAPEDLRAACQQAVSKRLNPLFKVHAVRVRESLPRNAANKLMRRLLRDEIQPRAKM